MREFKFRVFDKTANSMYYPVGSLYAGDNERGSCELYQEFQGICRIHYLGEAIIQQFTGLLDKSGKEIYEGDVLKMSTNNQLEPRIVTVEWNCFGFKLMGEKSGERYQKQLNKSLSLYLEVVGNILTNENN